MTKGIVKKHKKGNAEEYALTENSFLQLAPFTPRSDEFQNIENLQLAIMTNLQMFRNSSISEICVRLKVTASQNTVKRALNVLVENGKVVATGEKRWRKYSASL